MEWERIKEDKPPEEVDPCLHSQTSMRGRGRPHDCSGTQKDHAARPGRRRKTLVELAEEQKAKAGESQEGVAKGSGDGDAGHAEKS